jgi:hypothetical protein
MRPRDCSDDMIRVSSSSRRNNSVGTFTVKTVVSSPDGASLARGDIEATSFADLFRVVTLSLMVCPFMPL